MKNLLLFIFSAFIGIVIILFYFRNIIIPPPKKSAPLVRTSTSNFSQFSLEHAPSLSLTGNILSLTGSVLWQSRIATEPAQLTSPVPLRQGEKIVTGDTGNISLELGGGCLITVSPKTELSFIQTLPANVVFEQDQGTVNYTKTSAMPLGVRSLNLLTQISTGSASISADKKVATVIVEVNKGEVVVGYNNADFVSQVKTITAGNRFIFDDETKKVSVKPL